MTLEILNYDYKNKVMIVLNINSLIVTSQYQNPFNEWNKIFFSYSQSNKKHVLKEIICVCYSDIKKFISKLKTIHNVVLFHIDFICHNKILSLYYYRITI